MYGHDQRCPVIPYKRPCEQVCNEYACSEVVIWGGIQDHPEWPYLVVYGNMYVCMHVVVDVVHVQRWYHLYIQQYVHVYLVW